MKNFNEKSYEVKEAVRKLKASRRQKMFVTGRSVVATATRVGRRSIHSVPKLAQETEFVAQGIPGLYSPKGFKIAWTDYQKYLTTRLTLLTNGTADETRYPFHIAINAVKDQSKQKIFNAASQTHNNHFFFEQLTSSASNNTKPSRQLESRITQTFGSLQNLRQLFIDASNELVGQGWLFLVENDRKELHLMIVNNSGTPYYFGGNLSMDLNGPISEEDYETLELVKENVHAGSKDYTLPLFSVNLWDQAYLIDYGINNRAEYVGKVIDSLNWDVINKRVYAL